MNVLHHWATMARAYVAYRRGREPGYGPFRIWVEPSSMCQLRCVMCPNRDLPREMLAHMPLEMFHAVIDECQSFAYDVNLTHRGEPLLNPEIVDMVAYGARAGPKIRLHTNAMNLTRELSRDLIGAGLQLMSFSVDGFTQESYEQIRIGGSWELVMGNIRGFLEEKAAVGARRPYTIVQIIDVPGFDAGPEERQRFIREFHGLPVDEIYVKKPSNWAGSYGVEQYGAVPRAPCTFPWYALVVCSDGTIVPCPQDFFCRMPLGAVGQGGLMGAWRSEPMRALRAAMASRRFDGLDPCRDCDRLRRPRTAGLPATNVAVFLVENLLGYTRWKTRLFAKDDGTVSTK
ncbi:radical SAM protein [Candidatus Fermentibacteria bacterium]|nr:radical SAM protein [Candidatus Fermentibacteria bacterium]